jgi:hypothetical protein
MPRWTLWRTPSTILSDHANARSTVESKFLFDCRLIPSSNPVLLSKHIQVSRCSGSEPTSCIEMSMIRGIHGIDQSPRPANFTPRKRNPSKIVERPHTSVEVHHKSWRDHVIVFLYIRRLHCRCVDTAQCLLRCDLIPDIVIEFSG